MSSDSDAADQLGYVPYFQLWTDEELRWIDIATEGDKKLESFLLRWCEKRPGLFRRIWRFQPNARRSFDEAVWAEVFKSPAPTRHEES